MKNLIIVALALCLFAGITSSVAAQDCTSLPGGCAVPTENILTTGNTDGLSGGVALIQKITNWLFTVLLVLAVLFIIMAAFKYLFSGGSEEAVGTAHKMIIYAVVAIAVAFLARGIVFVVQELVATGYSGASGSSGVSGNCTIQYVNGRLTTVCTGRAGF